MKLRNGFCPRTDCWKNKKGDITYKIIEKIKAKQENLQKNEAVTIVFLGDSVTQGCFECGDLSNLSMSLKSKAKPVIPH